MCLFGLDSVRAAGVLVAVIGLILIIIVVDDSTRSILIIVILIIVVIIIFIIVVIIVILIIGIRVIVFDCTGSIFQLGIFLYIFAYIFI